MSSGGMEFICEIMDWLEERVLCGHGGDARKNGREDRHLSETTSPEKVFVDARMPSFQNYPKALSAGAGLRIENRSYCFRV